MTGKSWNAFDTLSEEEGSSSDNRGTTDEENSSDSDHEFKINLVEECLQEDFTPSMEAPKEKMHVFAPAFTPSFLPTNGLEMTSQAFTPSFVPTEQKSTEKKEKKAAIRKDGTKAKHTLKHYMKERMGNKWGFQFPDKGWSCGNCSNYNFPQRETCKRCDKERSEDDIVGKPEHLNA